MHFSLALWPGAHLSHLQGLPFSLASQGRCCSRTLQLSIQRLWDTNLWPVQTLLCTVSVDLSSFGKFDF